jgi:hypothetical protein
MQREEAVEQISGVLMDADTCFGVWKMWERDLGAMKAAM